MAWSWLCFGCHGAHVGIGHIGHIAAPHIGSVAPHIALAVAAPRVAPGAVSLPQSDGIAAPRPSPLGSPPLPQPAQTVPCTSIAPMLELPGDTFAVPTAVCGRHVIVQDAHTGLWREHR